MQITLDGRVSGFNDEMDWLINTADEWNDLFKPDWKNTRVARDLPREVAHTLTTFPMTF